MLKDQNVSDLFKDRLFDLLSSDRNEKSVEDQWIYPKNNLMKATEETCGFWKQRKWHKQTWWWDQSVNHVVNEQRRLLKYGKKEKVKKITL